jgi:Ca-activated chloride channel homolog
MNRSLRAVGFALLVLGLVGGLFWLFRDLVLLRQEPLLWTYQGRELQLTEPALLGFLALTPLLLYGLRFSLADLPWQQRAASLLLRVGFLALLLLGLSKLVRTAETKNITTVFVVDVSDSVTDEAIEQARAQLAEAIRTVKGTENQLRLVTFAARPKLVSLAAKDGTLVVPPASELRHALPEAKAGAPAAENPLAGSDLEAALHLAYGVFPPGTLKRAILFSDGVETKGDVLAEANRAVRLGVKVYSAPYTTPAPGEVALQKLTVPEKVEIGEPFNVSAEIYASRQNKARAKLFQGEMLNGLDGVRELTLVPGLNTVSFKSVVRIGGEVTYRLELDQIESDRFQENNRFATRLDVPGRPQILYVEGQPQRASYLSSALSAQQFDVDVRAATAFPSSLQELERYALVIVSDVPAEQFSIASQELLERYVRDLGGGFVFAGGEAGFGLGGWAHTTIERILPVRMDAERRKEMPSVAMMLVIDHSGSMAGLPLEMAKAACRATVGTLQGDDLIGVIAFDAQPKRYVKIQPARYRSRIQNEIMQIQSGGGTAIFPALDAAYQDLSVVQARKKHVILLTDGRADSAGIRDLVQAMVSESITVTTVGLGDGADGDFLRNIAETGGGRYHAAPDPNSLPRIFTREAEMLSREAAVQEWFPVTQTSSADFLKGIAIQSAPLLHGYVATQMKGPPAQQILVSDKGEPILARWRVGLGQTIAWTSDVKNNWAIDWLRWPGFSTFWGQLVREHMRQKHRRELDMTTQVLGDRVVATVDAFSADERFENNLQAKLAVRGLESKEQQDLVMQQIAPGRYQASFRLEHYGSFTLKAEHYKEQSDGTVKQVGVSYGNVAYPYPLEYKSFEPDVERLRRAAVASGGIMNPGMGELFNPGDEKIVYQEPLWQRFILAALVLFLLDLLVRRVRFFDRKFVAKRAPRGDQRAA